MRRSFGGLVAGILAFALLCELLFQVLPVSSSTNVGYHIDANILTYAPHQAFRDSTGWDLRNAHTVRANNDGFISPYEFARDSKALVLIGDSYVESVSLDEDDRMGAQLERALGGRRVYAMGAAGTSLLDYGERMRFAAQHYGTRDFVVVMERRDMQQSICGSGNIAGPCLDPVTFSLRTERREPPSLAKRVLRHSALAQYLASQLKIVPSTLVSQAFARTVPHEGVPISRPRNGEMTAAEMRQVEAVTRAFFDRVKPYITGNLIIVVDANRSAMMLGQSGDDLARQRFIELARAAGASVVDTETIYKKHFANSRLSLEIGPYDGHFNSLGVRLLTLAIADAFSH